MMINTMMTVIKEEYMNVDSKYFSMVVSIGTAPEINVSKSPPFV